MIRRFYSDNQITLSSDELSTDKDPQHGERLLLIYWIFWINPIAWDLDAWGVTTTRTVYGSLSRFGTLRKSKKITLNQECFLYPFFFKDDFYSIAYKRFSDGPSIDSVAGVYSMISAKRLIDRMRHQDYSEIIYSESGWI